MRFFAGLALVLVGFAFAQSQLVVPQINNINAVISLLPQFQGFLGQLDQILPQLTNVLSSVDIQSLKDKITQVVLSQVGSNLNLDAIKDKLRPILQQFLGTKPQARFDFDHVLQQIAGAATSALPSIILGMIGKRDAVDARVNLNDVLALANKYQLLSYIPQLQQFLNSDKLQQIQNQFFATLVAAAGNNWSPAALAQSIQQLVSQFVPQLGQSRIDWEAVGQSALNGIVTALPGIAIGLVSLLGKREATDARAGLNDILALVDKFQLQTLIPQIEGFLTTAQLQQLQNQFFSTVVAGLGNNWNIATLAQLLEQLVSTYVPQIAQLRIDWEAVGQSALNGLATALPGIAIGLVSLFGKREATDARAGLNDILALVDKFQLQTLIPQIEGFLTAAQLQQLQNQFLTTVVAALGNNWNIPTLAQILQQLVSQYVPQIAQARIDWEDLAQTALNGLASALPTIAISLVSLFGKRDASDARAGLDDILALVDKFQLQSLIPQIEGFLTPAQLQQLQNQFFTTVVAALGNNWNIATLAQLLQQLVSTYVPQIGQSRIDWEAVGQSALNGIVTALPGIAIGLVSLLGKREATDARAGLDGILALVDKFQLQSLIPQIEGFLTPAQLQQLQNQFFSTVVSGLGNNWNIATVAQLLQQLVSTYVPQIAQARIDWEDLAQTALNGLASALPTIAISLVSLFGKRDLQINYQQLLAQLPVDKLAQIVNVVLNTDKSKVLASLRKLLQSFFPAYFGRINFDELAANVLNHMNSILPTLGQSIFSSILG